MEIIPDNSGSGSFFKDFSIFSADETAHAIRSYSVQDIISINEGVSFECSWDNLYIEITYTKYFISKRKNLYISQRSRIPLCDVDPLDEEILLSATSS
jgi:hypothetical protein